MSLQIAYVGSHVIHNMFDSSNQANPNTQTIAGFDDCGAPPLTCGYGCTSREINPATNLPYNQKRTLPMNKSGMRQQLRRTHRENSMSTDAKLLPWRKNRTASVLMPVPMFQSPVLGGRNPRSFPIHQVRQLLSQSRGELLRPLLQNGHVHESIRSLVSRQINAITIHWDQAARLAVTLTGSHACCLGNRVFLGPTVGTSAGPTISEALHHELVHVVQTEIARTTGMVAARHVVETEARAVSGGMKWGVPIAHGANPEAIYTLWWLLPLAAALYVALRPNVANAPGPGDKLYSSVSDWQVAGEAFALFAVPQASFIAAGRLGLGFYGSLAVSSANANMSFRAVGDFGKGQFSGVQTYVFDGATGAIIGVVVPGGIRLIGSGATRSLDWLATQKMIQLHFDITREIANRAARSPVTQSELAELFRKGGLTGKAAEWWMLRRGTMQVYRGQNKPTVRILSPIARGDGGVEASERFVAEMREAGLSSEDMASYTAVYGKNAVPGKVPVPPGVHPDNVVDLVAPPGMANLPLGAAGIPTTRIPGVAAKWGAGESGVVYIIRLPRQAVIKVPEWGMSVENEFVVLNEIPPGSVVGKVPASSLPALECDWLGRLVLARRGF